MPDETVKKAGIGQVTRAVIWSFLGIRRRAEHESDMARITPLQVVVAGIIGAIVFVLTILTVVRIVISNSVS